MSIRVMTSVWQYSACKGSDLLLLLALADRADDDGYCYPKVATLAQKTRMSERSTQYNLKRLVEVGELEMRPGEGPYGTNLYRVITRATGGKEGCKDCTGGVQDLHVRGATGGKTGVQPIAPNTSIDTSRDTSKRRKAISIAAHVYDARFLTFWQHYPRKVNKAAAEVAFLALAPDAELLDKMVGAIQAQADTATFRELDHAPHASTWINNARWEDEVLPTTPAAFTMQEARESRTLAAFDEVRRRRYGAPENIIDTTGGVIHDEPTVYRA